MANCTGHSCFIWMLARLESGKCVKCELKGLFAITTSQTIFKIKIAGKKYICN